MGCCYCWFTHLICSHLLLAGYICSGSFVVDHGLVCPAIKVHEWARETIMSTCRCVS